MLYGGIALRRAREHHTKVLGAIAELPVEAGSSGVVALMSRARHEQTDIEGAIKALCVLGFVNLVNVAACLSTCRRPALQNGSGDGA
jgi:hypothetical protein